MSHSLMLWERVIVLRIRRCTSISKNHSRFMPKRSTMETILMRQMMEYYKAETLSQGFCWLRNNIQQGTKRSTLEPIIKKGIFKKYINILRNMYWEVKINVSTYGEVTEVIEDFSITIGLHQRLCLKLPFLRYKGTWLSVCCLPMTLLW